MIIHHCTRAQVRQLAHTFAYPAIGTNGRLVWRIPGWLRAMLRSAKKG